MITVKAQCAECSSKLNVSGKGTIAISVLSYWDRLHSKCSREKIELNKFKLEEETEDDG